MYRNSIIDEIIPSLFPVVQSRPNGSFSKPIINTRWFSKTDENGNLNFTVDVPGIPPDALKVEVHEGILSVYGEHEGRKIHKSFAVENRWTTDSVEARYEYGTLRLTLAESPKAKPKMIPVQAS